MIFKRIKWHCDECENDFYTWNDEEPVCAVCKATERLRLSALPKQHSDVPAPTIMHDATKVQEAIMEGAMRDMNMTNVRDHTQTGDISAPPLTHAQIKMRDAGQGFWGGRPSLASSMIPDGHAGVPKGHAMERMQNLARHIESNMK